MNEKQIFYVKLGYFETTTTNTKHGELGGSKARAHFNHLTQMNHY